jgi:hypothetical protein
MTVQYAQKMINAMVLGNALVLPLAQKLIVATAKITTAMTLNPAQTILVIQQLAVCMPPMSRILVLTPISAMAQKPVMLQEAVWPGPH